MIPEEDYEELPEDNELAFLKLEALYRAKLESMLEPVESGQVMDYLYVEYMNHVIAAASGLNLGALDEWVIPHSQSDIYDTYRRFSNEVASCIVQIRIKHSRRNRKYSVALDVKDKTKIRHHIEQIKKLVDDSELEPEKKDAIYAKISALLLEVDRNRTGLAAFADFATSLAKLSGEVAREGAEPWFRLLKPVFEILGAGKEKEERQPQLPPPSDRKRIEPPRQEKGKSSGNLDDEIPF